ncbi:nicotinate phosphoribosyltransferase [soil metagenome]
MNAADLAERGLPHGGLWLDRYHIDSIYIAWRNDSHNVSTFDLFARRNPFGGAFMLAAGLAPALDFAASFGFSDRDIAYLDEQKRYPDPFLSWLRTLRFTGDIAAIPEGTIAFANEPLLRVTAPYPEALALETGLLQIIGVSTNIATKAARMVLAAGGRPISDFSLRRAHHAWLTTRSAMLAGFASTSNLEAARDLGLPASGTVPHALIEAFPDEQAAFEAVAAAFPRYSLLLDTYDVIRAAHRAVAIAKEALDKHGHRLANVRLDSGDLAAQAFEVRAILDAGGWSETEIVVSGDLDDITIEQLVETGAPINGFGVGGRLIVPESTSLERPAAIGAVYKLVWMEGASEPARVKLSEQKHTWPGIKQVYRANNWAKDVIALNDETAPPDSTPLLVDAINGGVITLPNYDTFTVIQQRASTSLRDIPLELTGLNAAFKYQVEYSKSLDHLRHRAETNAREN